MNWRCWFRIAVERQRAEQAEQALERLREFGLQCRNSAALCEPRKGVPNFDRDPQRFKLLMYFADTVDALTSVPQPGETKDARCFDCGCPPHEGICPKCGHRHPQEHYEDANVDDNATAHKEELR